MTAKKNRRARSRAGDGFAKDDSATVAQWRNVCVKCGQNDEVKKGRRQSVAINGKPIRPGQSVEVEDGVVSLSDKGTPNFAPTKGWQMEPLVSASARSGLAYSQDCPGGFRGTRLLGHLGWSLFRVVAGFMLWRTGRDPAGLCHGSKRLVPRLV